MLEKRIYERRKNSGLSRAQLARELHICPSAEGVYEQGRRTPGLDILLVMSEVFDVSLDYLITGSGFVPKSERVSVEAECLCPRCWKQQCRCGQR